MPDDAIRWLPVPIPEFADLYEVGSHGVIARVKTPAGRPIRKLLKPLPGHDAPYVSLRRPGSRRNVSVARMVLGAFVGPPPGPDYDAFRFPDRDPSNNRLGNLRWARPNAHRVGIPAKYRPPPRRKLSPADVVLARTLAGSGWTYRELAERFGVSRSTIIKAIKRITYQNVDFYVDCPAGIPAGSRHPRAILDEGKVAEIRRMARDGVPRRRIAEIFGISYTYVGNIVRGEVWRNVKPPPPPTYPEA